MNRFKLPIAAIHISKSTVLATFPRVRLRRGERLLIDSIMPSMARLQDPLAMLPHLKVKQNSPLQEFSLLPMLPTELKVPRHLGNLCKLPPKNQNLQARFRSIGFN
jgi:hypothetical protein